MTKTEHHASVIEKPEWNARYERRLMYRTDMTAEQARASRLIAQEEWLIDEAGFEDDPEGAADHDLTTREPADEDDEATGCEVGV